MQELLLPIYREKQKDVLFAHLETALGNQVGVTWTIAEIGLHFIKRKIAMP